MKKLRLANIKYLTTLLINAIMLFSGCGNYENLTGNLDFLRFESFNCDVVRVEGGDSFLCQLPDREIEKIRLTGIAILPDKEKEAKKYSESILRRGTLVKVEPAGEGIDEDGSIAAYVFVPGGEMLNLLIIERGDANPVKEELSEKYMEDFTGLKREKN